MLAGMSLGTDIKRYSRGALPRIAIGAIVFLPLMYGALYLWAFWNPFAAVNKIPAAVVNLDTGTTVEGKPLDAGDQVVQQLVGSHQLDLAEVSAQEAHDGIEHGRYYFTITLPENFSKAVASPSTGNAEQAQLKFTYDDTNNYLSTIIAQDAAQEVLNQVNAAIGEQTIDQVLTIATQAEPKITQAVDGANELASGLDQANSGAGQLADGANELAQKLGVAKSGADQLAAGTAELNTAIDTATSPLLNITANPGPLPAAEVSALADRLGAVLETLADSSPPPAQVAPAVEQAISVLESLGTPSAQEAVSSLRSAVHPAAAPTDPSVTAELEAIRSDAAVLGGQLSNPDSTLRQMLTAFEDGGLHADILKLRAAGGELNSGADQLSTGLGELTAGGEQLATGAVTLHEGTEKLSSGATELSGGLNEAVGAIPHLDKAQGEQLAKTMGAPVLLDQQNLHEAPTFGTGFAPFFLSLALFVGGIITW
ncbi:MAG: YhgE/Pip family protein, partial [Tomitella sp.]|nr:YhgE/Pip family protein [Tomitella sp.]